MISQKNDNEILVSVVAILTVIIMKIINLCVKMRQKILVSVVAILTVIIMKIINLCVKMRQNAFPSSINKRNHCLKMSVCQDLFLNMFQVLNEIDLFVLHLLSSNPCLIQSPVLYYILNFICSIKCKRATHGTNVYLLKINNRNSRTRCEICSKLTIKTPERRQCLYC